MKKIIFMVLLAGLALTARADVPKTDIRFNTVQPASALERLLRNLVDDINGELGEVKERGTGNVFYVDSGVGSDSYDGTAPEWALATLDAAVAKCTANNGDVIYVMQNHAETLAGGADGSGTADGVDVDVAGVTIIGLGTGDDRPTFTYNTTTDEFVIGADNVTIYNLAFFPSVSEVVAGITIEDGADNFAMYKCEFLESTTVANEFDKMVVAEVDCNDLIVYGCKFTTADAVGCTSAISAAAGLINRAQIVGNVFYGEFSVAPIYSDQVNLGVVVCDNVVTNLTASQFAIEFTDATTGWIFNNRCNTTADYEVDPGSCAFWNNDEGAAMPEGTGLYDLVGTLKDAAAGTDVYPSGITNDSIIAMILSKAGTAAASSYNNTTDSLEALGDHVQTLITTAAGTGVYPTGVTDDSILAMLLSKSATASASSYNNTTDSQEAIADTIADILADTAAMDSASELQTLLTGSATAVATKAQTDKIDAVTLATAPVANSLAAFIASGGTGLGTQLATSKSLVDAIGTNGTTVADTATGVAGMIGVNDSDNAMDSSSVTANEGGSVFERLESMQQGLTTAGPLYSGENYLAVTVAFDGTTGTAHWGNASETDEVLTVTGAVRVRILMECTETCTGTDGGTIALWAATSDDVLLAATTINTEGADNTNLDAGEIWLDTSPTEHTAVGTSGFFDFVVVGGLDIGLDCQTQDIADGTIIFHVWWTPLDATGAVAAGDGGTL